MREIAIIGGGAAGFFCSIWLKRFLPECNVTIFEAQSRPLAKVSVTGGGRCNLTNSFRGVKNLKSVYPRGNQLVKRAFNNFSPSDTYRFFENELGVELIIQDDDCIFPKSQDAMEIVENLTKDAHKQGVVIKCNHKVKRISYAQEAQEAGSPSFYIEFFNGKKGVFDSVVIAIGGAQKAWQLDFLSDFNFEISPPTPSLFSLNLHSESNIEAKSKITDLQGTVIEDVRLSIPSTNFKSAGTLLITHTGISGPATLFLSSYASRYLFENGYHSPIQICWIEQNELATFIDGNSANSQSRQIANTYPLKLTKRLWRYLIERAGVREDITWGEIGRKGMNRLIDTLLNDCYTICSKGEHREEFVTCGGIALSNIDINTLEAKKFPGVYFAGEVLDIDGVTGGFNLQAAWSCGYTVALSIKRD